MPSSLVIIILKISAAGISRSTSFVIAFLMKEKMWTLNQAYKHVLECRSVVYPNYGFQIQLKRLEIFLGFMTEEECEKEIEKNKFNLINFD
jgi:protein-tyrosine phosphatase